MRCEAREVVPVLCTEGWCAMNARPDMTQWQATVMARLERIEVALKRLEGDVHPMMMCRAQRNNDLADEIRAGWACGEVLAGITAGDHPTLIWTHRLSGNEP